MKFIFAFLLLATLSMVVNAIPHQLFKRTTPFGECAISGVIVSPLNITLSPDPVFLGDVNVFTVSSGTLKRPVAKGDIVSILFFDSNGTIVGDRTDVLADIITPFSQEVVVNVPESLPEGYGIEVVVGNPGTADTIGCAITIVDEPPLSLN